MAVDRAAGGLATILAVLWLAACHEPAKLRPVEAIAAFEPAALDFGPVPVGTWQSREVLVQNIGYVAFSLGAVRLGGNPSYQVEVDGIRVDPGEKRTVTVRFHPLEEGALADTLTVLTDADINSGRVLAIAGEGAPAGVIFEPSLLDFETLELDSDRTLDLTVVNPTDLPLSVTITGAGDWQFTAGQTSIAPLATVTFPVTFRAGVSGRAANRLEAKPCERCTPSAAALVGNGVPSAFVFDPSPVPFEPVPVHEQTRSSTTATNITWRPVDLRGLWTNDESFTATGPPAGLRVESGGSFPMDINFAARHDGPSRAELTVAYTSDRDRSSQVVLDAGGGMPQLALAPASIDFGTLPAGGKVERVVRLSNAGTSGNLTLRGVRATGNTESFSVAEPSRATQSYPWQAGSTWPALVHPGVAIAPGDDWLDVKVYFQPLASGDFAAELVFQSDDRFHPERTVTLTGHAYEVGPCAFRVLPQGLLEFGNVPAGTGAVLGFRFENTGVNLCAVKDIHLSGTAGGAFFMPGGPLTGGVVLQDDSFAAQVAFKPPAGGDFEGELSITVNNPLDPVSRLKIHGTASESCLVAVPNYLDFGPIRYDCSPEPLRTLVSNLCVHPVEVSHVEVGPGTSAQFTIAAPPTPLTLGVGEGFEVRASYSRTVLGQHYSPLWVHAIGEPVPLLVPMLAETNHEGIQTETFVQGIASQLDVLLVIANTTTMAAYQARLSAAIPGWIAAAARNGVDLHVGVTTSGLVPRGGVCGAGVAGGEAGRLFPADGSAPRLVSSSWPNAAALLQKNIEVGTCHNLVQGLETMRAALSTPLIDSADDPRTDLPDDGNLGLLRPAARLTVVVLSDEDDHSGFDPVSYVQFLRTLKGPGMEHRTSLEAIVPTDPACVTAGPPGPRFAEVATQTGGAATSVCSGSYAALLDRITTRAAGPQPDFPLAAAPSSSSEVAVSVDGVPAAAGDWRYDAASRSIVFTPGHVPRPGQSVQVRYRSACPTPR